MSSPVEEPVVSRPAPDSSASRGDTLRHAQAAPIHSGSEGDSHKSAFGAERLACARCGWSFRNDHIPEHCPNCGWETVQAYASGPASLGVLRHIHFRRVISASFVSNVGNWMEMLGVQMIVAHETGSLKMMGYLAAAQLSPILVFGVLGGLVADRVNRRTLMVFTQVLLMLVAASLATVTWLGHAHPKVLLIISAVQGTVMAFNTPAWQVLTPRLVPRVDLTKAITLMGIQFNASRVVGPALAGMLLSVLETKWLFTINTVTFLAVVVAVLFSPNSPAPTRAGRRAIEQVREATSFIFGERGPFCVFLATVFMSFLAAPLVRMLPLYVINVYHLKDEAADKATGWFLAVQGLGAVLGGLALRYIPEWYPKHHFIPMAITGAGMTITIFAATKSPAWGYLAMFGVGFFWIWAFNQSWAALQHLVADHMRGRVMSIATVASFGITAVGNVVAGWVGDNVSARSGDPALGAHVSIAALSVILIGAGMVMLIYRVPEVDGMPDGPGPRDYNLLRAILASEHRPGRGDHATLVKHPSVLDDPAQTIEEREPS